MARYVKRKPKIFVLDTNIILHDYKAIRKFQDNDVVIPVVVIEELDKFKKGNDQLAFNARGFMRDIDRITEGKTFGKDGVQIGKGLGRIKIEPNHPFPPDMEGMFYDDIPDHRILATAIWVRDNNPDRFVALVTKDINLRMKSKAAGMEVQDYLTDRVEEDKIENSNKEVQYLDGISLHAIQDLAYGPENSVPWNAVAKKEPRPNQLYKIKNGDETICARYDADRGRIILVKNYSVYGIRPRNHEQKFAIEACLNPKVQLVSMTGVDNIQIALGRIVFSFPAVHIVNDSLHLLRPEYLAHLVFHPLQRFHTAAISTGQHRDLLRVHLSVAENCSHCQDHHPDGRNITFIDRLHDLFRCNAGFNHALYNSMSMID